MDAWRGLKGRVVFSADKAVFQGGKFQIPCGQCIGCRLERSLQWAVRMMHEASLHEHNGFLTLTYSPENLPADLSLNKRHWQLFAKRMRKAVGPFRFFHCGEYGDAGKRPHYHACIFGFDFPDKVHFNGTDGVKLYTSKMLDDLWSFGFCTVGSLTFESAAYVARYITKKITGPMADLMYTDVDPDTGEIFRELRPEYATMSRREGIGKGWYEKFSTDIFPSDFVVLAGQKRKVTRYYLTQLQKLEGEKYDRIKAAREFAAVKHGENNTHERLLVREEIQYRKAERLQRSYDNDSQDL